MAIDLEFSEQTFAETTLRRRRNTARTNFHHSRNDLTRTLREMRAGQGAIDAFVHEYYGTAELAVTKTKAFFARLVGRSYDLPSIDTVINDHILMLEYAVDDLTELASLSQGVEDGLADYQLELAQQRRETVPSLREQRGVLANLESSVETNTRAIRGLKYSDDEYHERFINGLRLHRESRAGYKQVAKEAPMLVYQQQALDALPSLIEVMHQGGLHAQNALSAFEHGIEFAIRTLPYFTAARNFGDDRSRMLMQADGLSGAVNKGIELAGKSVISFTHFSKGAGLLYQMPQTIASRNSKISSILGSKNEGYMSKMAQADHLMDGPAI